MTSREREILDAVAPLVAAPGTTSFTALAQQLGASNRDLARARAVYKFFVLERAWPPDELEPYSLAALYDLTRDGETAQARLAGPVDWARRQDDKKLRDVLGRASSLGVRKRREYLRTHGVEALEVKDVLHRRAIAVYGRELAWLNDLIAEYAAGLSAPTHKVSPARHLARGVITLLEKAYGAMKEKP